MVDITYAYVKKRRDFGRQPLFCEVPARMLDSINPEPKEYKAFGLRNPVHEAVQHSKPQSEHEANTIRVKMRNSGVRHAEGGWPKDVNADDEEHVARYRRRWEREDTYIHAVMNLSPVIEHYLYQNNAIELYQTYFTEMAPTPKIEQSRIRNLNVYRDPNARPVSCITWTSEQDAKLVASYAFSQYQKPGSEFVSKDFYVWDIEKASEPICTMTSQTATAWQVACSYRDPSIIVGGLTDGKVAEFDIRSGPDPVAFCPAHVAHRDPVSSILYIASRTHTEFFTGSSDGQCLWWDTRKLQEPIEQMTMTLKLVPGEDPNISNAIGVTSLQYERSLPTRFLAGMENGMCVNVNRKGRTLQEMMSVQWESHLGPVRTVQRNPFIMKMFVTCGDCMVRLWSEEIRSDCVISVPPSRHYINDVAWSTQRVSGFMTVCSDGCMYYWDLLRKYHEPIYRLSVTDRPLTKIRPHEEGKLVVMGDTAGTLHLVSLSDNLVYSGSQDKTLMTQAFERENHREHILEARLKEIRLKQRTEAEGGAGGGGKPTLNLAELEAEELELVRQADLEYKRTVEHELKRVLAAQRA